jgi:hypothetical protein
MSTRTKDRITQVKIETPCYPCRPGCTTYDICWIRSDLAKVGKKVRKEGEFTTYTVTEVYATKTVEDLEKRYTAWREFAEKLDGH